MTDLTPLSVLLLAALGGLGAAARYMVDWVVSRRWSQPFPIATVLINVTGSFLIGVLATGVGANHPEAYIIAATGFCGGYTTFSTAMVESLRLAREGAWRTAAWSTLGTLVLCVLAVAAGALLGHVLT